MNWKELLHLQQSQCPQPTLLPASLKNHKNNNKKEEMEENKALQLILVELKVQKKYKQDNYD